MKIAIQANSNRGKEIISLLESLGGIKTIFNGDGEFYTYYIDNNSIIQYDDAPKDYKVYTLEEFEKEFPFKIGDKVTDHEGDVAIITGFAYIEEKLGYSLQYENGRGTATPRILTPYKEMKEERNITLTFDKAKEWYKKGGELKEIALQAFTEKELTEVDLPKTWEEFCKNHPMKNEECYIGIDSQMHILHKDEEGRNVGTDRNVCPSQKSAESHLAMIQLEQLRNCWWGNWKPEWNASHKYAIKNTQSEITIIGCSNVAAFLVFPTMEMAKEFLECFRDLIEQAGDLI